MLVAFVLLGLAIGAVWVPRIPLGRRFGVEPWIVLFVLAIAAGLVNGLLTWPGVLSLALLVAISALAQRSTHGIVRFALAAGAALIALALALHVVPGFNNPIVLNAVTLSPDAEPFTQYANFDKGAAGLVLLAFFCRRLTTLQDLKAVARVTLLAIFATSLAVTALSLAAGYVRFEPKLPAFALMFLAINLLFTCVAEEAFFRGLLQEKLTQALGTRWQRTAIAASAGLFGLAHFAGGLIYVLLATLAGLGYAVVYARTRRVESAILTHFGVNAIHFFGFTYPHLIR